MEPPHEEQYSQESNPREYMTMRDYRNLAWQNQQPWERNPNPPRSMRDYRDHWMSAPSYMVPPQYISTPQPPQPPQLISPVEQAILDLTKLVGDVVEEQKKINAQLSQKIDTMENNVNKRIDGLQSEMEQKLDNLQYSISKLAQHLDHPEEESQEEDCQSDIMAEEQCEQQPHQELIEDFIELSEGLAECDAPKPGGPLTTRQPAECKWMSGYPTPLQKIGQSLLRTGSSTQLQNLHILHLPIPNSPIIAI